MNSVHEKPFHCLMNMNHVTFGSKIIMFSLLINFVKVNIVIIEDILHHSPITCRIKMFIVYMD